MIDERTIYRRLEQFHLPSLQLFKGPRKTVKIRFRRAHSRDPKYIYIYFAGVPRMGKRSFVENSNETER